MNLYGLCFNARLITRPVARFQYLVGHNTFFGGQDFCFYYVLKTNFSVHNKIWGGTKKILEGNAPECSPRGYGPAHHSCKKQANTILN